MRVQEQSNIPVWYLKKQKNVVCVKPGSSFLRKALASFAAVAANDLISKPECSDYIYNIDSRIKVLCCLLLVFAVSFIHSIEVLSAMLIFVIALSFIFRIPPGRIFRIWFGVPLFGFMVAIPAIFNLITPGTELISWNIFKYHLAVTDAGVVVASRLVLRILCCVSIANILVATSKNEQIVDGVRKLGLPKVFGTVITMMNRYILVLLKTAQQQHLARLSRSIGGLSNKEQRKWISGGMGSLFISTYKLAGEVHRAMVSRGYDGDLVIPPLTAVSKKDFLFASVSLCLSAGFIIIDKLV